MGLEMGHNALVDVMVLQKLYPLLLTRIAEGEGLVEGQEVGRAIEISSALSMLHSLPLGKYRGKTFEEVAQTDRQYLSWLAGVDTMGKDIRYTARHWLGKGGVA